MEAVQNIPYEGRGTKTNAALGTYSIFDISNSDDVTIVDEIATFDNNEHMI